MTISILAVIVLILIVWLILRGAWLGALLIVIFVAYSSTMFAAELRWLWKNIETQKITL